jgi:hypothetical protein
MWNKIPTGRRWPPKGPEPPSGSTIAGAFIVYDVVIDTDGRRHLAALFREEGSRRDVTVLLHGDLLKQWLRLRPALFEPIGLHADRRGEVNLIGAFGPSLPDREPARIENLADLIPDALAIAAAATSDEEEQAAHREGDR